MQIQQLAVSLVVLSQGRITEHHRTCFLASMGDAKSILTESVGRTSVRAFGRHSKNHRVPLK